MFANKHLAYRFANSFPIRNCNFVSLPSLCFYNTQQPTNPPPNARKEYYTAGYKPRTRDSNNPTSRFKEQQVPKYVSLEERQKQDTVQNTEKLQLKKIQSGIYIRDLQSILSSIPVLQGNSTLQNLKTSIADELAVQHEKTYSNTSTETDRTTNLVLFLRTHFEKLVNAWSLQMQQQLQSLDLNSESIKSSLEKQNELVISLSIKLLSYCVHEIGASITNFDFAKILSMYELVEKNWIYHFLLQTNEKEWILQQFTTLQTNFNQSISTLILSLQSSIKAAEFVYLQLLHQRKLRISELKIDNKEKQVQQLLLNGLIPNVSVFAFFFHMYAKQGQQKNISRLIYEMKKVFGVVPNIDIYMATILLCLEQGAEEQAMRVLDFVLQNKTLHSAKQNSDKQEVATQRLSLLRNVFYRFLNYFMEKNQIEQIELLIDKFIMMQEFETQLNLNKIISTGVLNVLLSYGKESKQTVTEIMQMAKQFDILADGKTAELLRHCSFGSTVIHQVYGMKFVDFEKMTSTARQEER